jgi:hypothetical protein
MSKKLLAAVLGGIAYFAWSSVAHMALPLGKAGFKEVPGGEQAITSAMSANIHDRGMYLFPGLGLPENATSAQQSAAMNERMRKVASGPSGLLIYNTSRSDGLGGQLAIEFLTNVLQIGLAVMLLSFTRLTSFAARWRFVTIAGILACISTNISYWNWYGFPAGYTLAYTFTVAMGFVFAGLVVARLLKPAESAVMARAA